MKKARMILPARMVIRANPTRNENIQKMQRNSCQAGKCLRINIRNENDMPQRQGGFGYGS